MTKLRSGIYITAYAVRVRVGALPDKVHAEGNANTSYLDVAEVNAELDRLAAEPDVRKVVPSG